MKFLAGRARKQPEDVRSDPAPADQGGQHMPNITTIVVSSTTIVVAGDGRGGRPVTSSRSRRPDLIGDQVSAENAGSRVRRFAARWPPETPARPRGDP
jgi:hypothetical protein